MRFHAIADCCALIFVGFGLSGCAYTNVIPIDFADRTTQGTRVYDVKPILIISDSETKIEFVPNYRRAYAVQFGAFLAKNDFKIEIEKGAIKNLSSNLDTTAVLELLKALGEKAIDKFAVAGTTTAGKAVSIYEFAFDDDGTFLGLCQLLPIPKKSCQHRPGLVPLRTLGTVREDGRLANSSHPRGSFERVGNRNADES